MFLYQYMTRQLLYKQLMKLTAHRIAIVLRSPKFNAMSASSEQKNEFQIRAINRSFIDFENEKERVWTEPFIFIQSADTQFGLIDNYFKNPNPGWDKEIALTREAIKAANLMTPKPKFFIVCGDLVDAMPGTRDKEPQIFDFKNCFKDLNNDIPLVCVCGNHDIGDRPTHEAVNSYRKSFGDDFFCFPCGGVLFIVLNSQYYKDTSEVQDLADEQSIWLDNVLKDYNTHNYKHVVVFQHIPWFLFDSQEENDYFNIDKEIREQMLKKFYDAGVRAIFCGHYHRNAGGKYKDMEIVVTSAIGAQLGDDKSGLRIVKVFEHSITHKYYNIGEIPANITL